MLKTMIPILGLALLASAPAHAAEELVWSVNFDNGSLAGVAGPFGSDTRTIVSGGAGITAAQSLPGFGSRYLRNSGTGTTSFKVTGLDAHDALRLTFDLALLDSWDRPDDTRWGPDYLYVTIGDTSYQWAPAWPGTLVGRGSYAVNSGWQDSVYRHSFLIPHFADTFAFSIRAGGKGFQGGNDESWGIDNISLQANAVPEPATWAMLIAGFGLVGAAMRRKRLVRVTA